MGERMGALDLHADFMGGARAICDVAKRMWGRGCLYDGMRWHTMAMRREPATGWRWRAHDTGHGAATQRHTPCTPCAQCNMCNLTGAHQRER
jgi:hypothetical protein